jgi:DNA-binding transcriptional MerR regulator
LQLSSIEYTLYLNYIFPHQESMLINELARRTGVSIHTLRYYESLGFFRGSVDQSVKTNSYKNYDESLVVQIGLIKDAKEVGFTLAEIKFLLEGWTSDKLEIVDKIAIFTAKIDEIDLKIGHLKQMKRKLTETIKNIKDGDC